MQALQKRLEKAEREIREGDDLRLRRQQEATASKVGLAQVDERLTALRARRDQLETDLGQRERRARAGGAGAGGRPCPPRREPADAACTRRRRWRTWYLRKEEAERRLAELAAERDRLRGEKNRIAEEAQANRGGWRERQEQAHARELEVNDLRHRRDALCDRLREDYQLDLAELYQQAAEASGRREPADEAHQPAHAGRSPELDPAAEEEIAELRRKLSRLGNVNLDAIQELNELEIRAETLRVQYDDLTSAQRSLQEIIGRINTDSRRLFLETFAVVRTHFQELFRKLFGGGMADVVLEDETDILESGIEIMARPPGKELRSISLMSGGEKTMTAVALLLAIFRASRVRSASSTRWTRRWTRRTSAASPTCCASSWTGRSSSSSRTPSGRWRAPTCCTA